MIRLAFAVFAALLVVGARGQNPFIEAGRELLVPGPPIPLGNAVIGAQFSRDFNYLVYQDLEAGQEYPERRRRAIGAEGNPSPGKPLFRMDTRTGRRERVTDFAAGVSLGSVEFVGPSGDVVFSTAQGENQRVFWAPVGAKPVPISPLLANAQISIIGSPNARSAFLALNSRAAEAKATLRLFFVGPGGT